MVRVEALTMVYKDDTKDTYLSALDAHIRICFKGGAESIKVSFESIMPEEE